MRRLGTGTGFACAKLSEVLPSSRALLAQVRMTEKRFGTGTGFACAKLSEVLSRSERSLASVKDDGFCEAVRGTKPNPFSGWMPGVIRPPGIGGYIVMLARVACAP